MKRFLSLAVLLTVAGVLRGDILPPGHKRVDIEYVLTNLDDYPGYAFYVYSPGRKWLEAGVPFRFPAASILEADRKLSAIPRSATNDDNVAGVIDLHRPPFTGRYSIPLNDPADRVAVHYRISVVNGTLDLQQTAYKRYDRYGLLLSEQTVAVGGPPRRWWYFGVFCGVGLLIWLGLLIRWRRAAVRAEPMVARPVQ